MKFRAGQFKYPFTKEGVESVVEMPMILRAESVHFAASKLGTAGNNFRDIGVQVMGDISEKKKIKYTVAVINGNGLNLTDNNQYKDLVGSLEGMPVKKLQLGLSAFTGRAENRGAARAQWEYAASFYAQFRSSDTSGFRIRTEILYGDFRKGSMSSRFSGGYTLVSYIFPFSLELAMRGEYYIFDASISGSNQVCVTSGASWNLTRGSRLRVNYLLRNAGRAVAGNVHIQETTASGAGIGNLFIVQLIGSL
jgi:hypothetical protein